MTKYAHIGPVWKRCIHAWYGAQGHEEDLEKFLNGRLIVKPYFENNDRMFEEKISNLKNPFAFKIPVCLENERLKYLGSEHRIRNLEENIDQIEMGFVPWFTVKKFINSCAEKPHRFMSQKVMKCLTDKKLALTGLFYKAGNWDELKKKEYLLYEDVPAVYSDDMFHPLSFSRPKSYFDGRSPYFLGDGNLIPRQLTLVFDDSKEPSSTMCEDPVKLSHQIIAFGVGGLLMWIVEKYVFMPLNLVSVSISPESL